ncbi:Increased rDNA silencing protein [Ascochyta clinopodiicola]|nr:Increased rDNA silencing protein [Ascochyta clinopodiicola]
MSSSVRSRSVVPQSTGDTQHNVRDAALIGATSAFARPPAKPQHLTNTYTGGSNGALLAATKVGTGRPSTSAGASVPLQRDYTGGSSRSAGRPHPSPKHVSSSSSLSVPDSHIDRAPSPSYTAAKLAAARLSPLRPAAQTKAANTMSGRSANERDVLPPSGSVGNVLARLEQQKSGRQTINQQSRKRRSSIESHPVASVAAQDKPTDATPIPPTISLVKMFEQNRPVTPTQPPSAPSVVVKNSPPPVKSPKPRRNFTLPPEPKDEAPLVRKRTHTPPPVPKSKPAIELPRSQLTDGTSDPSWTHNAPPLKSPPIKQKPVQLAALNTRATTGPATSGQGRPKSEDSKRSASFHRRLSTSLESNAPSSPASFKSAKEELEEEEKAKPALPPPRRSNTRKNESFPTDAKLLKPSVPAPRRQGRGVSPLQAPERFSPPDRPSSAAGSVYHNPYQRESVKAITKHMTDYAKPATADNDRATLPTSQTASPSHAVSSLAISAKSIAAEGNWQIAHYYAKGSFAALFI